MARRFRGFLPVVIDVECGGFNPNTDALLEIAAVLLEIQGDGSLKPGDQWRYHVQPFPGAKVEAASLAVTGIDPFHPLRPAIPEKDAFSPDEAPVPASASVLLRHRGSAPPIAINDIQRLVAGAVPGLTPAQVSVVASPVPTPARLPERELSRFGPVTVTRASVFPLRTIFGGALFLNLGLLGALFLLWTRARKAESNLAEQRAEGAQGAR